MKIFMIAVLLGGALTLAGEREYGTMMIKIKGFDEERGLIVIEPSPACKKAKYATVPDMSAEEIRKFVEETEGKRIGVAYEDCKEVISIIPMSGEGEKEVF